jgi:hypothetical protein
MAREMMKCDCCGGYLPMRDVWEYLRDTAGDCTGSVTAGGYCRAFNEDDWRVNDMAETLNRHGWRFSGNNVADVAQDWLDHDFTPSEADEWCEIGVWAAETAADLRDAGLTPERVKVAAADMVEGLDDPGEEYTDGDPIYAACNGDLDVQKIIDVATA